MAKNLRAGREPLEKSGGSKVISHAIADGRVAGHTNRGSPIVRYSDRLSGQIRYRIGYYEDGKVRVRSNSLVYLTFSDTKADTLARTPQET